MAPYRKIFVALLTLAAALAGMLSAGCADEGYTVGGADGTPGTITIAVATGGTASRSDVPGSPDALSPATDDERRVSDLRYFIFPVSGSAGRFLSGTLTPPLPAESAAERYKTYTIDDVLPGDYHVYVVANMPACADVTTEADLRRIVLEYSPEEMPVPGNLPMVYEPLEVTTVGERGADVTANLQFTCVKVRYSVIFSDKAHAVFGKSGLMLTGIGAERLSSSAPLVLGGAMSGAVTAESFDAALPGGRFYGAWTRDDNAPADRDVITVDADAGAPASYAADWVYQGVLYLPERYVSDDAGQSALVLEGVIVDDTAAPGADGYPGSDVPLGSRSAYTIPLGHADGEGQPRQFPRGTYYEIVAEVTSRDVTDFEAEVRVADWVTTPAASPGHVTLTIDKTRAHVNSIEGDSVRYLSNAADVELGCELAHEGKPLIVLSSQDAERGVIRFGMNPAISIEMFREGTGLPPKGETLVWLRAGHLFKYFTVEYEAEPFFEVTPVEATIHWLDGITSDPSYEKTFAYRTNLGGIKMVDGRFGTTYRVGKSDIFVQCPGSLTDATGTFYVRALTNPERTSVHNFTVGPSFSGYESFNTEVAVTVTAPVSDYNIYFRVINDFQGMNTDNAAMERYIDSNNVFPEGSAVSWGSSALADWNGVAYLYAYTQVGETVNGAIPQFNVWNFTEWASAPMVKADEAGWWHYSFLPTETAINMYDGSTKIIKPAETLLMFHCGEGGQRRHRCPHHLDAGIQLFDYEDREGWIVYDPLCDPYYKTFDNRPEMENVTYDFYTEARLTKWYAAYGHAGTNNGTFNLGSDTPANNTCVDSSGKIWYKNSFQAKSPRGDYAKAVRLEMNGSQTLLYGGNNYLPNSQGVVTGHYASGRWFQGAPSDVKPFSRSVYCYAEGWGSVWLYTWVNSTKEELAAWPGTRMEYVGNGWFKADIDTKYDYVIFSNGGSYKTADLYIASGTETIYKTISGDDTPLRP